jgi:hypothetical protein
MRFATGTSSGSNRSILFNRRPLVSLSSFILAAAVGLISSFTFSTAYDMARFQFGGEFRTVAGVWRGQWHGVHAVTIKLTQNGDSFSGTARFNRIIRTDDGPHVEGVSPELPLSNLQFDGHRLSFEIHLEEGEEVHPRIFVAMEMWLENEDEALLRSSGRESTDSSEEPIRMRREPPF